LPNANNPNFVEATTFIGKIVTMQMDRPLGSRHPRWDFFYPVNYGFLPGVPAPDGDDLDVYLLGIDEPRRTFTGRCIAVIHRLDDADDKLVVVPDGVLMSNKEIRQLTHFQEQFFRSVIVRNSPDPKGFENP
jgi:inorganic pyrophosphatase